LGKAGKGEVALLANRNQEGTPFFDDLARGLDTGAISRGKAMKLSGAALVASALGLIGARGADAQETTGEDVATQISRRKCNQKGGDYCKKSGCSACCGKSRDGGGGRRRKRKACCGTDGCRCCKKCGQDGKCK
jgi:hypothetical protein